MSMKCWFGVCLAASLAVLAVELASADEIQLRLVSFTNGNHQFFHRLLVQSLAAAGHTVVITELRDPPQPRIVRNLEKAELSVHWMLQTSARDAQFASIPLPLTRGLIGQRIMLVPKIRANDYMRIQSLADLRASGKVAGLGQGWFDVQVWKESGLPYIEQSGNWASLYAMLASEKRGFDYFPRGVTEVLTEAAQHPELAIEPHLLLTYDRDLVFYLPKANIALKALLESALRHAEKSGLQKKLIDEYFGVPLASLNLSQRTVIELKSQP